MWWGARTGKVATPKAFGDASSPRDESVRLADTRVARAPKTCRLFHFGEFFDVDPLQPVLKIFCVLSFCLDLEKKTFPDEKPERSVFSIILESFENRLAINRERFAIASGSFGAEIPVRARGGD